MKRAETKTEHEVLTLEEAAALLRLCSHTLAKRAKAGAVPGRKIGREWRFVRSELLRFINGSCAA